MEILITSLVAVVTALIGAFFGYYLGFLRTRRLQTADFVLKVLSLEFSEARIEMREMFAKHRADFSLIADWRSAEYADFRQRVTNIFNTYDVICALHTRGDIDTELFDEQLKPIIASDYELADPFFASMAACQEGDERNLKRPFFPCIAKVAPRSEQVRQGAEDPCIAKSDDISVG